MSRKSLEFAITNPSSQEHEATLAPVWSDLPHVRVESEHADYEVRTADHPLGRVAIIGDCFADADSIDTALNHTLTTGDLSTIGNLPGNYRAILTEHAGPTTVLSTIAGTPIYYNERSGRIGSRPSFARDESPLVPDTQYIAAQLALSGTDTMLLPGRTSYDGISKIQGGMALTSDNGVMRTEEYDPLAYSSGKTFDQAASNVRDALITAVQTRLDRDPHMTADLSGGMDSSSLSFLAANYINPRPLNVFRETFTAMPDGDSEYVRRFLEINPQLNLRQRAHNDAPGFSYEEFESMRWTEDLVSVIDTTPYIERNEKAYYELIDTAGSALHMNGSGGDEVVGTSVLYLTGLLAQREYSRFVHESIQWARIYNIAPTDFIATMAKLSGPHASRRALDIAVQTLESPQQSPDTEMLRLLLPWQPTLPIATWLTPGTRRNLIDIYKELRETDIPPEGSLGDRVAKQYIREASTSNALSNQLSNHYSRTSPQSPFLDTDVVRAAFSIPSSLRGNPHVFKHLLTKALEDVIPPEVLARRSKGVYDYFFSESMRQSKPALLEIMRKSYLGDLDIINPNRVMEVIDGIDTASAVAVMSLDRIVSTEAWLRGLERQQGSVVNRQNHRESIAVSKNTHHTSSSDRLSQTNSTDQPTRYTLPSYVYAVASKAGSLVLFNEQTNRYHPLEQTRSMILRALTEEANLDAAVTRLIAHYPTASPEVLHQDAVRCLDEFISLGILHSAADPSKRRLPHTVGTIGFEQAEIIKARHDNDQSANIRQRILAATAFILGELIIGTAAPNTQLKALRFARQKLARRKATTQEAEEILRAAQTLPSIGRIACREAAYTASLSAALQGKDLPYHQGPSFEPLAFHAWVSVDGKAVRTASDSQVTGSFQSFFTNSN